jgi:adenylate cyclase
MRPTLRVTLLTVLLTLVGLTVASLGLGSYLNAKATVEDLSSQVLDQASLRVDERMRALLHEAAAQAAVNCRLIQSNRFGDNPFAALIGYWIEIMQARPALSRVSYGVEATGEWVFVRRLADDSLLVGDLLLDPKTKRLRRRNFSPEGYPNYPTFTADNADADDVRRQPWYRTSVRAGRQVWTGVYLFQGVGKGEEQPGLSSTAPVLTADGRLRGAVTASFDLVHLCRFLAHLPVGQHGFVFVVEQLADGSRRLVAHPDEAGILHTNAAGVTELMRVEDAYDGRVRALLARLPATLQPDALGLTRLRFESDGVRYLGGCRALASAGAPDMLICMVLPEEDMLADVRRNHEMTLLVGVAGLLLVVLLSLYISRQVAQPLEHLACEAEAIGHFEVEARTPTRSIVREVDRLGLAVEDMKTGLRSFRKYVPARLVQRLLASGQEAQPGGEGRTVTVFFSDVAGFTSLSEQLSPDQLMVQTGEYLEAFTVAVLAAGGTVDKYIGDAVMAFWGAPEDDPRQAERACRAALDAQQRLADLRTVWAKQGRPAFFARIGIHTGPAVVGNVGSTARLNYTVIGDSVNLASRLEGLNKYYDTEVLVSADTLAAAAGTVLARAVDRVSVKGKREAVLVYELLGLKGQTGADAEEIAVLSAEALECYGRRDWPGAQALFEQLLRLRPGDGPARLFVERCAAFRQSPPGDDWDGVHRMEEK